MSTIRGQSSAKVSFSSLPKEMTEKELEFDKFFATYDAESRVRLFNDDFNEGAKDMIKKRYPVPPETIQAFKEETYERIHAIRRACKPDDSEKTRKRELVRKYVNNWKHCLARKAFNKWRPQKGLFECVYELKVEEVHDQFIKPVAEQRQRARLSKTNLIAANREISEN